LVAPVAVLATHHLYAVVIFHRRGDTMFGNKDEKRSRLEQMVVLVAKSTGGMTQAALARALGVTRSTVNKDLQILEKRGVRLSQDRRGRLFHQD
jgi:biotin operon repressor